MQRLWWRKRRGRQAARAQGGALQAEGENMRGLCPGGAPWFLGYSQKRVGQAGDKRKAQAAHNRKTVWLISCRFRKMSLSTIVKVCCSPCFIATSIINASPSLQSTT